MSGLMRLPMGCSMAPLAGRGASIRSHLSSRVQWHGHCGRRPHRRGRTPVRALPRQRHLLFSTTTVGGDADQGTIFSVLPPATLSARLLPGSPPAPRLIHPSSKAGRRLRTAQPAIHFRLNPTLLHHPSLRHQPLERPSPDWWKGRGNAIFTEPARAGACGLGNGLSRNAAGGVSIIASFLGPNGRASGGSALGPGFDPPSSGQP